MMEIDSWGEWVCGKHDFGFLRVFQLKKINEMPVVNGICELAQIVKLLVPSAYWWKDTSKFLKISDKNLLK